MVSAIVELETDQVLPEQTPGFPHTGKRGLKCTFLSSSGCVHTCGSYLIKVRPGIWEGNRHEIGSDLWPSMKAGFGLSWWIWFVLEKTLPSAGGARPMSPRKACPRGWWLCFRRAWGPSLASPVAAEVTSASRLWLTCIWTGQQRKCFP